VEREERQRDSSSEMQLRLLALGALALAALVQPAQTAPDTAQMMKTLDQASELCAAL
jgi:hypothetical protein